MPAMLAWLQCINVNCVFVYSKKKPERWSAMEMDQDEKEIFTWCSQVLDIKVAGYERYGH